VALNKKLKREPGAHLTRRSLNTEDRLPFDVRQRLERAWDEVDPGHPYRPEFFKTASQLSEYDHDAIVEAFRFASSPESMLTIAHEAQQRRGKT